MKAVVAAFNQEKALVGAFSVITNLRMELFEALATCLPSHVSRYRGPWHCLTDTLRQHGVRGVLTGLVPHWWRDGHGFGV